MKAVLIFWLFVVYIGASQASVNMDLFRSLGPSTDPLATQKIAQRSQDPADPQMFEIDFLRLRQKFHSVILGVLVGDSMGAKYDGKTMTYSLKRGLQRDFDLFYVSAQASAKVNRFTDDSDMTYSLARSLVVQKKLDLTDLAKRFVESYYAKPDRSYSKAVKEIFKQLKDNGFTDVLTPAAEKNNGQGFSGNGAAMRVSPVALYCYNDFDTLLAMAKEQSIITHSHQIAIYGAILQAVAVHIALNSDPRHQLNPVEFIDELMDKMAFVEQDEQEVGSIGAESYKEKLEFIRKIMLEGENMSTAEVIQQFGNGGTALKSVPTAIYCFLRATRPIKGIQTNDPLRRAIQYAISLGGDTPTIGSMTGAIAGAFYGDGFPSNLLRHCEGADKFRKVADELFDSAPQ